jgi:hypothetical protein
MYNPIRRGMRVSGCAGAWMLFTAVAAAQHSLPRSPELKVPPPFELKPLPLVLPSASDPYADITGKYLYDRMLDVVGFSRQAQRDGLPLWGRIAGTKYTHMTAEYMARQYREIGLEDVHTDKFPTGYPQWWPTSWEVRVPGAQILKSAVPATAASLHPDWASPPTPAGGIEAPMVYIGLGTAADLVGKDLKGKIVVLRNIRDLKTGRHTVGKAVERIRGSGHVGRIVIMAGITGTRLTAPNDSCPGGPCEVPTFDVTLDDGEMLEDLIGKAGVSQARLRLNLQVEVKRDLQDVNAMGILPGAGSEYVILLAHTDGWFEGASRQCYRARRATGARQTFRRHPAQPAETQSAVCRHLRPSCRLSGHRIHNGALSENPRAHGVRAGLRAHGDRAGRARAAASGDGPHKYG